MAKVENRFGFVEVYIVRCTLEGDIIVQHVGCTYFKVCSPSALGLGVKSFSRSSGFLIIVLVYNSCHQV